jgi:hypothetical protein
LDHVQFNESYFNTQIPILAKGARVWRDKMHKRNQMTTDDEELSHHLKHTNMSSKVILHGIVYKKLPRFVNCMKGT